MWPFLIVVMVSMTSPTPLSCLNTLLDCHYGLFFVIECPYKMFYIKMFCCDQASRFLSFGIVCITQNGWAFVSYIIRRQRLWLLDFLENVSSNCIQTSQVYCWEAKGVQCEPWSILDEQLSRKPMGRDPYGFWSSTPEISELRLIRVSYICKYLV